MIDRPLPGPINYVNNGPPRGVLHITQSSTTSTYDNGAKAPQITVDVFSKRTWRHYPYQTKAGKALKHTQTQPTNTVGGCVQIEVLGFCDNDHADHPMHISKWGDEEYAYLHEVMAQISEEMGIPMRSGLVFIPFADGIEGKSSAGTNNGVRMSNAEWAKFTGWCGHMHVPQNVHGDPGNINIAKLLGVVPPTTPNKKDNMQVLIYATVNDGTQDRNIYFQTDYYRVRHVISARALEVVKFGMARDGFDNVPKKVAPEDLVCFGPLENGPLPAPFDSLVFADK